MWIDLHLIYELLHDISWLYIDTEAFHSTSEHLLSTEHSRHSELTVGIHIQLVPTNWILLKEDWELSKWAFKCVKKTYLTYLYTVDNLDMKSEHAQDAARAQGLEVNGRHSDMKYSGSNGEWTKPHEFQITIRERNRTNIDRNRTNSYYIILHSINVYQYITKDVKQQAQRSTILKNPDLHDFTGSPWIFRSLMPQLCSFTEVNTLNCSIHVARVAWRDIQKKRSLELQSWKALRTCMKNESWQALRLSCRKRLNCSC